MYFGVDNTGVLIAPNENTFAVSLSAISDFSVDFSDDSVEFFDKDNTPLFVSENYKLNYDNNVEQVFLSATKNQERALSKSVDAECTFGSVKVESKQSVNMLSVTDKIEFLHRKGYITEEERIYAYIDALESGAISDSDETTYAFLTISTYSRDNVMSRDLDNSISNLVRASRPVYTNESVYTYDFFSIHYETGEVSTQNIDMIYLYLDFAKTSLCDNFRFITPKLEPGQTTYHVYLVKDIDNTKPAGASFSYTENGVIYTYAVIYYTDAQNQNNNYTYNYGTACHEFTHAVQWEYLPSGCSNFETLNVHFNEAFANAVKVRLVPNSGIQQFVNIFLDTPDLSLLDSSGIVDAPNRNRCYGALLFPLFLMQEYNDFNTIKQIYEENREINNIYNAIDNVLQRENSSIGEAYSTFARYNYNLRYYYDYVDDAWNNSVTTKTVSTVGSTYNSPILSSNYFETNYAHYESFAVTFHNANYINYAKLQRIDTIDEVLYNTNYSIFSPNVTAVFHINAGEKTCFILSNISSVYNAMTYTVRFIY